MFSYNTIGSLSKNPIRYYPQGVKPVNITKRNNPNSKWRENKGYSTGGNKLNSYTEYIQKFRGYPSNILQFARNKNAVHPTQKPVALLEYLIKTYTQENQLVLDNTMGSGSTGVACMNTNRRFIGIEFNPEKDRQGSYKEPDKYFKHAKERIEKAHEDSNR